MTEYFVLISRPAPSQNVPTPEFEQNAYAIWGAYLQQLMQAGQLVTTHQLRYTGKKIVGKDHTVSDVSMDTAAHIGWLVIRAEDDAQAVAIAQGVPFIALWGGTCEVRPMTPAFRG